MPIKSCWISRKALIKLLGEVAAARVIEAFRGAKMLLPAPDAPGFARLAEKLGDEVARKLCTKFGGAQIMLPLQLVPLNQEIIRLRREQLTPTEIARQLHCAERYVYLVLSRQ